MLVGMPDLSIDTVTRTAVEVAHAHSFPVSVLGSVPTCGGSRYIEILLRVDLSGSEPRHIQLGVFRNVDIENLRTQIGDQLRRQLERRYA